MDLLSNDDNITNDDIQKVIAEEIQLEGLLSLTFVCQVQGDYRMNIYIVLGTFSSLPLCSTYAELRNHFAASHNTQCMHSVPHWGVQPRYQMF